MTKITCLCAIILALIISTRVFSQVPVPVMELPGHADALVFSPDGKLIATTEDIAERGKPDNYVVKLWDVATGEVVASLGENRWGIDAVAFSPDSKLLLAGGEGGNIDIWDVSTKERVGRIEGAGVPSYITSLAFHPDGKEFVSGSGEGKIQIWDVASLKCLETLPGHMFRIEALDFSPDGKLLASVNDSDNLRLWDFATRKCVAVLKNKIWAAYPLEFSPDGKLLAIGGINPNARAGGLALWDVQSRTCVGELTRPAVIVFSVAFSPDNKLLVCGAKVMNVREEDGKFYSAGPDEEGLLFAWDVASRKLSKRIQVETDVECPLCFDVLAFSPDSKLFAANGYDRVTRIWNAKDFERETLADGEAEFQPKEDAQSVPCDNTIKMSDDLTVKRWFVFPGQSSEFRALTFSRDGTKLAAGGNVDGITTVKLADIDTGKGVSEYRGATGWLTEIAFSPDGRYLVGCQGSRAWLWDVATGKLLKEFILYATDIAFSPDSSLVAIVHPTLKPPPHRAEGFGPTLGYRREEAPTMLEYLTGKWSVVVWDVNEKKTVREIALSNDEVKKAVFSANRKTIITVQKVRTDDEKTPVDERSAHGVITFWDIATGEKIKTIEGDLGTVAPVAFDSARNLLAVGGGKVWYEAEEEWDRILRARRFGEEEPRQPEENYWIHLWNLDSGKPVVILKEHTGNVNAIAFSPDGKLIVSGGQDNTLKFWDADSGKLLGSIGEKSYTVVKSIVFSPDGSILATFNRLESGVRLWKIIRTPVDK